MHGSSECLCELSACNCSVGQTTVSLPREVIVALCISSFGALTPLLMYQFLKHGFCFAFASATSLLAADLVTWPSQYTIRPWETSRLTAADVVGPDGIVYPDFTGVGVTGGIPDINNAGVRSGYTVFNVVTYGAFGDGTTNDDTAVAAAATAANSFTVSDTSKAILYFPAGTYPLSAPIDLGKCNIVVDGDGPTATLIKLTTGTVKSGALFSFKRPRAYLGNMGLAVPKP